jgi:hypothetical protein
MTITGSAPFPYITKDGGLESFKTVDISSFSSALPGDIFSGSYPYSSSISSDYFISGTPETTPGKIILLALKNTFNSYKHISPHYSFDNKETEECRLISIPSIFYGQSIRKGSLDLKFYISGSLVGRLQDTKRNGELLQTEPVDSEDNGKIAGVVLYNEGFVYLSGSWSLSDTHTEQYNPAEPPQSPSWLWFMTTGSSGVGTVPSSSFGFEFEGTERIPTVTMFAKAEKGEFNHSNNQTYIEYGQNTTPATGSNQFSEKRNLVIKNIAETIYDDEDPPLEKTTYISKIALYDKDKNLIGVAKLATPVKKKQNDNIAFKLKLDF